jgi:uncharacterized membrane protein
MLKMKVAVILVLLSAVAASLAGCAGEETVSYSESVQPILAENCLACHQEGGEGYAASGLSMSTYEELMAGGRFGPMVIPGDAEGSNLVVLMEGRADPSISMPHGSMDKMATRDITTIRTWINQGAKNN